MWSLLTSWAAVLVIAPELANAGSLQLPETQNVLLTDAANWLNPNVWGAKTELGQRYLCAHNATMSLRRGAAGQITDVGAGPAKVSYRGQDTKSGAEESYSQTAYGKEYWRLLKSLPGARFAAGAGGWYGCGW